MSAISIRHYLSLVKFSHTVFALPVAIIGFFLGVEASGENPDWTLFAKVVLCMVFARSAAMGFNRYIDRRFSGNFRIQHHQTLYMAVSFGFRRRTFTCSNWSLLSSYRIFQLASTFFLFCSIVLDSWFRHYLCFTG